ncbi:NUDIX hydrolase [Novosphingobium endophyticum]|uniref:NUDIX hydrolase n=1 Tax=Novosphingobium endophyticum TaxID=1955250 RepID=A0A916X562_9SPHN|nr:NUDIX domain-containing protein [Novosphingobium endophyticum]GGB94710.1 NUDIX hydrolase [Novosphingobium endophyticum]
MNDTAAPPQDQTIVRAATVIVFRSGSEGVPEILMVQRSAQLSFAGAAVVFPGGKIAPADEKQAAGFPAIPTDEAAARIAGIREVLEETGLILATHEKAGAQAAIDARAMLMHDEDLAPVLDRFGWTLDLDQLVPFARWVPTFKPGRIFDTRFYLADLGSGRVDLTPDLGENTRLFWASAKQALDMIEMDEIKAIYPTRRNLERLARFASFAEAKEHALNTPMDPISPWVDGDMLRIPEGAGYPVTIAPLSQIRIS